MSTKGPHIVRTALQNRQKSIIAARVSNLQRLSPTVRGVQLKIDQDADRCEFKAGQWLDLFVPGLTHIGGFSMCSPPSEFVEKGILELAIKISDDPAARWVHEKCTIGDQVRFRFGGDFYYDPEVDEERRPLCLIAGGVGVNPLVSILTETLVHDVVKGVQRRVVLLQTAKREEELLFEDKTKLFAQRTSTFNRSLFVTEPTSNPEVKNRRISESDILAAKKECGENANYFICGPSTMIEEIEKILLKNGVSKEQIFFEKWS